jgi:cellulose synthase (UDP-forming)
LIILVQHARENVVRVTDRTYRGALGATFASILALTVLGAERNGMAGVETLAWGTGRLSLFRETYSIAGAGLGEAGIRKIRFEPRWLPQAPGRMAAYQKDGRTEPVQQ